MNIELIDRPCPLCGGGETKVIYASRYPRDYELRDFMKVYRSASDNSLMDQLVQCRDCGLLYVNPLPKGDLILSGYEDAEDPVFVNQNPFRIRTFEKNMTSLMKKFEIPKGVRVLDVGCAGGAFPKAASNLGLLPTGVEPSVWMCDFARRKYGLDIRAGTLEEQAFAEKSFDIVTFWDVLEHLTQPGDALSASNRVLKDNGLLMLTFPDIGSKLARLMGRKWPFLLSVHLTYYTRKTIESHLKKMGFLVLHTRAYWQTLSLEYIFARASSVLGKAGLPLKYVSNGLRRMKLGNIPFSYYMAQSLVVARKK
ncbi:MAG: class I SAM-dependent methyltransferase [Synergistaceae bacterium]|jgi:ubiquinone/menaquinone biosynthesis C-methylase UbiE|nr:class I SAM-dependent methyltransferase [Synergistaceae bacterium]